DFVEILEHTDLRNLRQPYYISSVVETLLQDKTKRERGLALLRKAWKELPDQRPTLITRIRDQDAAQVAELYDLVEQAILPRSDQAPVSPWSGVETISSWGGNGQVSSPTSLLLQTATRQGKLDTLADKIQESLKHSPQWRGGRALLAIVEARRGRVDAA